MGIKEQVGTSASRLIWKGLKHASTAVAGFATTVAIKHAGIELTPEQQGGIAIFVTGLLGAGLKKLKDLFPKQLGWL